MQTFDVIMRSAIEGKKLIGHAAVFGQLALIEGRYWEELERSAFDDALKASDAIFTINHDPTQMLGRQASGTLKLGTDSEGLAFELDLPNTTLGNDVREMVARGDLNKGSFRAVPGKEAWGRASDGRQIRRHQSLKSLKDVSLVTIPAYEGTSVMLRSMTIEPESNRSRLVRARHSALLTFANGGK